MRTRRTWLNAVCGGFALVAVAIAPGCARRSEPAAGAASGAATVASPGSPIGDTLSLEAARDTIERILRRSIDPADTAIHIRTARTEFEYAYAGGRAPAWEIVVTINDTTTCVDEALRRALVERGWIEAAGYGADGTDGSTAGFVAGAVFCHVEGSWDGGDDSDSTYVPVPGCWVTVTIAPARLDDTMRFTAPARPAASR